MIFDVKMDFIQKAQFVARRHKTETPALMTYSSVASHESVRIAFTVAALNNLDFLVADSGNTNTGPEFGSHAGKHIVITRVLYGLKSSGAAWRAHLASMMTDLSFTPCQADPDICPQAIFCCTLS